jgi:hypothetical protein
VRYYLFDDEVDGYVVKGGCREERKDKKRI